jgi:cytochrome c biogenesis protein CcmG, thiol:disulfide interchange protein DsbE
MLARVLNQRLALRAALVALALALLAYGVIEQASSSRRRAPALPARAVSGATVTLAQLRGHTAAVVFFATWCGDCHKEATAVARFAHSATGRGRVIAVDYSDGGDWRAFVHAYDWSFPVFGDRDGTLGDAYRVEALPTTVIIDARGRIAQTSARVQTVASLTSELAAGS